jgi:hypothetical protein
LTSTDREFSDHACSVGRARAGELYERHKWLAIELYYQAFVEAKRRALARSCAMRGRFRHGAVAGSRRKVMKSTKVVLERATQWALMDRAQIGRRYSTHFVQYMVEQHFIPSASPLSNAFCFVPIRLPLVV